MSNQSEPRISFVKNKVSDYKVGVTGITGTSEKAMHPYDDVAVDSSSTDLSFNSSELLFKNIDKLGLSILHLEKEAVERQSEDENDEDRFYNLSEDEMILNLDHHLGFDDHETHKPQLNKITQQQTKLDNFCRNCGINFEATDNFCGNCGRKRT